MIYDRKTTGFIDAFIFAKIKSGFLIRATYFENIDSALTRNEV